MGKIELQIPKLDGRLWLECDTDSARLEILSVKAYFVTMGINFKDTRASLKQVAQDFERLLKEQQSLVSGAKDPASHAKESQVLFELAKLPVDRLKDVTEEKVCIEAIRKYGFQNVASIYNSSASSLNEFSA